MARVIPGFIDESSPPGEREVYRMLADGPDDWAVLHALDLAPWHCGRRTEVDFVVIIPDSGILCIEVKSQHDIYFDGERWHPATIKRSPFKQALDARFALRRRLTDLSEYAREIPILHCCIFPFADFELRKSLSIRPWELMDRRDFCSFRTSAAFCASLRERLRTGAREEGIESLPNIPPQRIDNILELCVPIRKRLPTSAEEIRRRQEEMDRVLREQQRPVLQLATWNPRLLVTGGAGTGKTLIAMELARRIAENGERVALVCFNRLVGEWMAAKIRDEGQPPNLLVGSAFSLLIKMAEITLPPAPDEDFWDSTLPSLIEERFTDPDIAQTVSVDYLIVDEAQDILTRPPIWDCLASLVAGGTGDGRFALFGDIDQQVLSSRSNLRTVFASTMARARPVVWHLSENCRNYRVVGETALRLSGFPADVYSGYLRTGGTPDDIGYAFYSNVDEQVEALRKIISHARSRGFRNRDITVLSFCAPERGVAPRLRAQGFRMAPAGGALGDEIRSSSVTAFKGLESPVVIVTDIDLSQGELSRALFYTAVTRSTAMVRVLCKHDDAARLAAWAGGLRA